MINLNGGGEREREEEEYIGRINTQNKPILVIDLLKGNKTNARLSLESNKSKSSLYEQKRQNISIRVKF